MVNSCDVVLGVTLVSSSTDPNIALHVLRLVLVTGSKGPGSPCPESQGSREGRFFFFFLQPLDGSGECLGINEAGG